MSPHELGEVFMEELMLRLGAGNWTARDLTSFLVGATIKSYELAQVTAQEYGLDIDALIEEHDAASPRWVNGRGPAGRA